MNIKQNYDYLFKVALIGAIAVGKTRLMERFADNTFTRDFRTTLGVDFRFRSLYVDMRTVQLRIWDTAGDERCPHMTDAYCHNAHGIMMLYDITNYQSFQYIRDVVMERVINNAPESALRVLIGCKADMEDDRMVSTTEASNYADINSMLFFETSAKDAVNVEAAFLNTSRELIQRREGNQVMTSDTEQRGPNCQECCIVL